MASSSEREVEKTKPLSTLRAHVTWKIPSMKRSTRATGTDETRGPRGNLASTNSSSLLKSLHLNYF